VAHSGDELVAAMRVRLDVLSDAEGVHDGDGVVVDVVE
jgi:hypothetical protein